MPFGFTVSFDCPASNHQLGTCSRSPINVDTLMALQDGQSDMVAEDDSRLEAQGLQDLVD